jgi:hypothetical protein
LPKCAGSDTMKTIPVGRLKRETRHRQGMNP